MVGGDAALTILRIDDFSYDKSLSKGRKVVWVPARHSIYTPQQHILHFLHG
jgi:hypothetical protein